MKTDVGRDVASRGILFMLGAIFFFSCMDALAKWMGATYAVAQLVFFRSLFGFLPLLLVIRYDGGWSSLRTRRPLLHAARGLCVLVAIFTYFVGIQLMPLAEALTLAFTSPLFMIIFSVPLLGERVGPHRWGAVLVGFVGVIVIVQPGPDTFRLEALWLLTSGVAFALASTTTRMLSRTETTAAITFYSTCGQFVPAALMLPFFWSPPIGWDWALFVAMGLLGGTGLQLMTLAFRNAPVSVVAPFEYTALLWATLLGWIGWNEWPGDRVWAGAAILIASGLYIGWRESRRRQPARAAEGGERG